MTDLHELLSGILAEEGLVLDGLEYVVQHQVRRRDESTLGVRRVVSQVRRLKESEPRFSAARDQTQIASTYPVNLADYQPREPEGSSSDQRGGRGNQAPLETLNLKEVFGDGPRLDVVVVGLAYSAQEVDRVRVAHVPLEGLEHVAFRLQNLGLGVRRVGAVEEVLSTGGDDLLDLCGDEEAGDADELEFRQGHDPHREEPINDVDREEERLWKKPEAGVDLDEPVRQDATHVPGKILLHLHVVGVGHSRLLNNIKYPLTIETKLNVTYLDLLEVVEDVDDVLAYHEGIIRVLGVQVNPLITIRVGLNWL